MIDVDEAIRECDSACPCYLRQRQCGASKPGMLSTGCDCWPSIQQDARERITDPACIWPGHAAIRALRSAAYRSGLEEAAKEIESHTSFGGGLNKAWANDIRSLAAKESSDGK